MVFTNLEILLIRWEHPNVRQVSYFWLSRVDV